MELEATEEDVWTGKLFFTEFDRRGSVSAKSEWTHSCLRTPALTEEICGNHNITVVRLYRKHVNAATHALAHRAFVVFKTEGNWKYSIEKNKHGITLQRSKCLSDILHSASEGIAETEEQTGRGTIAKVVHFLWENNYLEEHYHPLRSNSSQFARRIFSAFSYRNPVHRQHQDDSSDEDPGKN